MRIYFLLLMMAIVLTGFLIMGYWYFIDGTYIGKVIDVENPSQIKTEKTVYHLGELVKAYFSFCKYRNITAIAQWSIVNDTLQFYPIQERSSGIVGCRKDLLIDVEKIPLDSMPSIYHFSGTVSWVVNPLKTIIIHYKTNDFQVIP